MGAGASLFTRPPTRFTTRILLLPPASNPYGQFGGLRQATDLVGVALSDQSARLELQKISKHVDYVLRAPAASPQRLLAGGLFASCLVGTVCLAFFDGFSFPMMPGLWFVVMGLAGAGYRLTRLAPRHWSSTGQSSSTGQRSVIR